MKVIWLLEELKHPYERIDVGGPFGKTNTPEYLAMNPTSLVPTLEDNGFTLWESNAILRYICQSYATASDLFPPDPRRRGVIDQWMDFQQTMLNRPQSVIFQGMVRTPPDQRNNDAIAAAVVEASRPWSIVDKALAGGKFITGPTLTLADIVFGVHVHRWFNMSIDRPKLGNLQQWYEDLLKLPIYAEHIARPLV